jgi:hypothetical protein
MFDTSYIGQKDNTAFAENVSTWITTPVPEPAVAGIMGMVLAITWFIRRRYSYM